MTNPLTPHLDFANHHPNASEADLKFVCDQVMQHGFNAAFMNPVWVPLMRASGYPGKIGTIVSFPLGQEDLSIKTASAVLYLKQGANEIDAVCNISLIKAAKWDQLLLEFRALVTAVKSHSSESILKIIPECGYLTPEEIKKTAELMVSAGVDYFKTCSGLGPRGAIVEDVKYVKEAVGEAIKIKCAGGIDTLQEATDLLNAGAVRLGTSKALEIIGVQASASSSPTPLNE